jgi:hypothetical protein
VWQDLPTKQARRIAGNGDGVLSSGDRFGEYINWFFDTARVRGGRTLPRQR